MIESKFNPHNWPSCKYLIRKYSEKKLHFLKYSMLLFIFSDDVFSSLACFRSSRAVLQNLLVSLIKIKPDVTNR